MNLIDYNLFEEALNSISLPDNWYIILPAPEKLKNFDSLNCRTVIFIVTDVSINKKYIQSFNMIEDLYSIYHLLQDNEYIKKNINLLDFAISQSSNKKIKSKTHSFTIHYTDKIIETLKVLNENNNEI